MITLSHAMIMKIIYFLLQMDMNNNKFNLPKLN